MIQIIAIDGCLFVGFTLFIYSWGALKQGPSCMKSVLMRSFFFSLFSRIRTKSPDSVSGKNSGPEKLHIWTLFTQIFSPQSSIQIFHNPFASLPQVSFYLKALSGVYKSAS